MRKVVRYENHPKVSNGEGIRFPVIEDGFQFVSGDDISFVSGDDFELVDE